MESLELTWLKKTWNKKLLNASLCLNEKRIFCAYNAFIDCIEFISPKKIDSLLKNSRKSLLKKKTIYSINSVEDFASALIQCLETGKAQHIPCYNKKLLEWLSKQFNAPDKQAIGGQAGIISHQASLLGAKTILYSPKLSKELSLLINEEVRVPTISESRLSLTPVRKAWVEEKEEKKNWIFEFKKGSVFNVLGKKIRVPRSSRLIISSPPKALPCFEKEFQPFLKQLGKEIDYAFFSGYHYFTPENDFKKILSKELTAFHSLKSLNKKLVIHFEYVPLDFKQLEKNILQLITKGVDSLGINEVEIIEVLQSLGFQKEANAIKQNECAFTLFKGAEKLFHSLKLKRIHVHNLGYSIILLKKPANPIKAIQAILCASIAANTRAILGKPISLKDFKKGRKLPISQKGLLQLIDFSKKIASEKKDFNKQNFLKNGFFKNKDHLVLITPTQIAPNPRQTVGLGDVVSFISLASQ